MSLTRDELRKLLELLEATQDDEIDCEELLGRLGGFIERFEPDRVPPGYEHVIQHLRVCAECFEEFEALYRVLRGKDAGRPESK
jgi:hypothetical protein